MELSANPASNFERISASLLSESAAARRWPTGQNTAAREVRRIQDGLFTLVSVTGYSEIPMASLVSQAGEAASLVGVDFSKIYLKMIPRFAIITIETTFSQKFNGDQ